MDVEQINLLGTMYDSLQLAVQPYEKKGAGGPILLYFLRTGEKKRYGVLVQSAMSLTRIASVTREQLLDSGYIREIDRPSMFCLTAKGVWEIENSREIIRAEDLIQYIDSENFNIFGGGSSDSTESKACPAGDVSIQKEATYQ